MPALVETQNQRGEVKIKPNIVRDYKDGMSGIDRSDQMLSYHSALHKTICWCKKVCVHFVEKMLINVFYMSQLRSREMIIVWR